MGDVGDHGGPWGTARDRSGPLGLYVTVRNRRKASVVTRNVWDDQSPRFGGVMTPLGRSEAWHLFSRLSIDASARQVPDQFARRFIQLHTPPRMPPRRLQRFRELLLHQRQVGASSESMLWGWRNIGFFKVCM